MLLLVGIIHISTIYKNSALLWLKLIIDFTILRTMDDNQSLIGIESLIPTTCLQRHHTIRMHTG